MNPRRVWKDLFVIAGVTAVLSWAAVFVLFLANGGVLATTALISLT